MGTNDDGDILLDLFLGSGTTCAVAHKLGRQYIGIEQLDYGENDSLVRLSKVVGGDKTGISRNCRLVWGGSFLYCELLKWNQKVIEKIQAAKSDTELTKIWEELKGSSQISYKVSVQNFDSAFEDFSRLALEDKRRLLFDVVDKDNLYVNYCDLDDEDYAIAETDKSLNKKFYERWDIQ